jgi:hypothetical protein
MNTMKAISKKFFLITFIAAVLLGSCNEPGDPEMNVMVMGSWQLSDLFVNEQVVTSYSNSFTLDIEYDQTVIFVNQDGIGMTGSWEIDDAGTTLTLTPDLGESPEPLVFDVLFLLKEKMGLRRTVTSNLMGETVFTYVLVK